MKNANLQNYRLTGERTQQLLGPDFAMQNLPNGTLAHELAGFSSEAMAKFYHTACQLFEQHNFVEACNSFLFLTALNPQCYHYWLGLGMASQRLGEFEAAIDAYEIAATYHLEDPVPYFYLAKCLFAMHEKASARQALDMAIHYADDQPEFQEVKQQAMQARELL